MKNKKTKHDTTKNANHRNETYNMQNNKYKPTINNGKQTQPMNIPNEHKP